MTTTFALLASAMVIVTIVLMLTPLLRELFKALRRLDEARLELKALEEAHAAAAVDPPQYAARRAALGEALLAIAESRPRRAAPMICGALAVAAAVPLAAVFMYQRLGSPRPATVAMTATASAVEPATAGPPIDHGTDMQGAIARLAEKLRQDPADAQGWALLGRTYKAMEHYAEAREAFRHALEAAPGDPDLEREYAGAGTPSEAVSANDSARVVVKVSLDPKLKGKVLPGDTLFVFARAAQGPAMPLAIARLTAAQLPASVTLTDAMSMLPNLKLSQFPQLVLGARISKSGNPVAQSGDFQTVSSTVSNASSEPIRLTIDRTVE